MYTTGLFINSVLDMWPEYIILNRYFFFQHRQHEEKSSRESQGKLFRHLITFQVISSSRKKNCVPREVIGKLITKLVTFPDVKYWKQICKLEKLMSFHAFPWPAFSSKFSMKKSFGKIKKDPSFRAQNLILNFFIQQTHRVQTWVSF